jgi:hypothetical protein
METMMPTTVRPRSKKASTLESRKRAAQLIRELPEEKIDVALPFLEFLKFLEQSTNGKEFDVTDSIKQGIKELAQLRSGKLKPKSFEALLNEQ